ncbi:MAG: hypothetical protein HXM37_06575 [Isoptericola variabilis]|nr:hypothetical protein [Isoptericola variabilis]
MTVPPLFDHLDIDDEDQLRRDTSAPLEAGREADAEHWDTRSRPSGMRARAQAWLHVEPFYWTMRVVYVCLAAGAVFAVYINGVAEGWWHAWGEKPSVAATAPATQPTPAPSVSSEAAMSGGYQVGPDGVLVRPAQYAADTYTKPELPEEAKENTERGAEAAAEHYLALMAYAWNTGDTQPFEDMSDGPDDFHQKVTSNIRNVYSHGWTYDNQAEIEHVLDVHPVDPNGSTVPPNTISVAFLTKSSDGTTCQGTKVNTSDTEYKSILALLLTWQDGKWIVIQGTMENTDA